MRGMRSKYIVMTKIGMLGASGRMKETAPGLIRHIQYKRCCSNVRNSVGLGNQGVGIVSCKASSFALRGLAIPVRDHGQEQQRAT
jgi:hypothetical protein